MSTVDVAFAPHGLSCGVRNPLSFHAAPSPTSTVDHRRRRARFTVPCPLAVHHQRHVMRWSGTGNRTRQLAEPAVDRTPMPEVGRQHAPAAARTDQITHRVNHLADTTTSTWLGPGVRAGASSGAIASHVLIRQVATVIARLTSSWRSWPSGRRLMLGPHATSLNHTSPPVGTLFQTGLSEAPSILGMKRDPSSECSGRHAGRRHGRRQSHTLAPRSTGCGSTCGR